MVEAILRAEIGRRRGGQARGGNVVEFGAIVV